MAFSSWDWVVDAVARFLEKPARLQHLLERLPQEAGPGERRRSQYLLYGVIRHKGLLEKLLGEFLSRPPRRHVQAALLVAAYELMAEPDKRPLIVDNAVTRIGRGREGKGAKGLANAVLRKAANRLPELLAVEPTDADGLSWRCSHPKWLVKRWLAEFGLERTKRLLDWNLKEPEVFVLPVRDYDLSAHSDVFERVGENGYWKLNSGNWATLEPLLESGKVYVQNPASGVAPRLLAERVKSGRILDLCSAPGGKAIALDQLCADEVEEIVCLDLAGRRFERLQSNLRRCAKRCATLEGDLFEIDASSLGTFQGVLLDAPCSNLGVLQRKLDVKWRLSPAMLDQLPKQQLDFLKAASRFVAPQGSLIYSLCSFDRSEGEEVVRAFLDSESGAKFRLSESEVILPGEKNADGGLVYSLVRRNSI